MTVPLRFRGIAVSDGDRISALEVRVAQLEVRLAAVEFRQFPGWQTISTYPNTMTINGVVNRG